ncbi:outer membrane protein [Kordiimonas aestuarii]|uniref:outer membrane protein n=1 Tax=Kordiimonas aestuarii TaxID=1005925 RepID=UPI0021CF7633|nr:porin family protein [Kordiimonas aestuarii]
MKFTKTLIATTAATALFAGAATAQDAKYFEGIYSGIEAGVDWTKMSATEKRDRSIYYGGVLGYRMQSDTNMVFGVEGTLGDTGYNQLDARNTDYEYSGSLILGQAFGPDGRNLVYGKAGYARTRFDLTDSTEGGAYNDGGWRFGAGYERALMNGLSFRTGVDYTSYGDGVKQWTGKAGLLASF